MTCPVSAGIRTHMVYLPTGSIYVLCASLPKSKPFTYIPHLSPLCLCKHCFNNCPLSLSSSNFPTSLDHFHQQINKLLLFPILKQNKPKKAFLMTHPPLPNPLCFVPFCSKTSKDELSSMFPPPLFLLFLL